MNSGQFKRGQTPPVGTPWPKGVSGNPRGRLPNPPPPLPDVAQMIRRAMPDMVGWLIDVGRGKVKGISADLRTKVIFGLVERVDGKPEQRVAIDVALKRALEKNDPVERLRILQDLRADYRSLMEAEVIDAEAVEVPAGGDDTTGAPSE